MTMKKLIQGGTIVNEGQKYSGDIVIEDGRIAAIIKESNTPHAILMKSSMPRGVLFCQV